MEITGLILNGITDNHAIYIHMRVEETVEERKQKDKINNRKVMKLNHDAIKKTIDDYNWEEMEEEMDPDVLSEKIQNTLQTIIKENTIIVNQTNHYNTKKNNWMTKEIMRNIRKRDKLIYKRKKCKDKKVKDEIEKKVKLIKQKIEYDIRNEKNGYYKKIIKEAGKDSKKQWKVLNEITGTKPIKKVNKEIKLLKKDGVTIEGIADCAENMNTFFINLTEGTNPNLVEATKDIRKNEKTIFMNPTTKEEITRIISEAPKEKAAGEDGIKMVTIYNSIEKLAPILVKLANICMENGKFPKTLKTALITPIHKKGEKNDMRNFRPIANMNSMAKILEKIIYSRFYDFLVNKCKTISNKQYAFRKGKSLQDALLDLSEDISITLDRKEIIAVALIDV